MNGEIVFAIVAGIIILIGIVAMFIIGGCVENNKAEKKESPLETFQPEFNINIEGAVVKVETVYVD